MSDKTMPITGGCLCGAVRYEASERPKKVPYCHCKMCQRWSGSVLASWADFGRDGIRCTKGEITYYRSSDYTERGFCAECGSSLVQRPLDGDWFAVATGSLDDSEAFLPDEHCGIESQVSWLNIDDRLPRKSTQEHMGYTVEEGGE